MTAGRWQRVREILYAASQIDSPGRARYVTEQCGDDTTLRTEVEELLEALQQSGGFLESAPPVLVNLAEYVAEASPKHTGRRAGPYQLLEEIGQGGMGEVYRAVRIDGHFEKQVAVKLVRGGWDSTFIGARFRQERQVLARLEHPNIARLLDGGTEDGIPYVVMELIEGTPIDQYCEQHQLSITARLRLFDQVCAAVQYAH
jgi:eukaryotic-like serine/threonine-protein kinase